MKLLIQLSLLFLFLTPIAGAAPPEAEALHRLDQWLARLKSFDVMIDMKVVEPAPTGQRAPHFRWRADGPHQRWEGESQSSLESSKHQICAIFDGDKEWVHSDDRRVCLDLKRLADAAHPLGSGFQPDEAGLFVPNLELTELVKFCVGVLDIGKAELRDNTWVLTGQTSPTKLALWADRMQIPLGPEDRTSTQTWQLRLADDGSPVGITMFEDQGQSRGLRIDLSHWVVNVPQEAGWLSVSEPDSYQDQTIAVIFDRSSEALMQDVGAYNRLVAAHPDWPRLASKPQSPTLLHFVARYGNGKLAKALNPPSEWFTQKDLEQHNPLMVAVAFGNIDTLLYFCQRPVSERKAMLAQQDTLGDTALHLAALSGQPKFCQFLLKAGADKNARNKAGQRPADVARSPALKKLLLK